MTRKQRKAKLKKRQFHAKWAPINKKWILENWGESIPMYWHRNV